MTPRGPRADAVRNRARILDAAREQISTAGPEVGMDRIAAAAGVAVGTLYRHFATKSDLVSAVVAEYLELVADDAAAAADRVRAGADAAEELIQFVRDVIEVSAQNHAAKAAAGALAPEQTGSAAEARAAEAIAGVLRTAQAAATIRADLTVDDIYLIVATAPYDRDHLTRGRWLTLVLPALRHRTTDVAPPPSGRPTA